MTISNERLRKFVRAKQIRAGFIVTCVGGLHRATVRSADIKPSMQDVLMFEGDNENNFEITSLAGLVNIDGIYLHMSIADSKGKSFGGHLKEGSIVYPTAEVVIGEDTKTMYAREYDETTGYKELVVKNSSV